MNDPLNIAIPLGGVDTSLPVMKEQDVEVQCSESTIDKNKDGTGLNWNLTLKTTVPVQATDDREIKANFPVFFTCALQAREDSKDVEAFKRMLGGSIDALFGTSKENRPDFTHALAQSAVGKTCIATVYPDEYPKGSGQFNTKVRRLKATK